MKCIHIRKNNECCKIVVFQVSTISYQMCLLFALCHFQYLRSYREVSVLSGGGVLITFFSAGTGVQNILNTTVIALSGNMKNPDTTTAYFLVSALNYPHFTNSPFHKSSYECFSLYKIVEPVLNYRCNKFVTLMNLCETGPRPSEHHLKHEATSILIHFL